jgi:hypothetical protein
MSGISFIGILLGRKELLPGKMYLQSVRNFDSNDSLAVVLIFYQSQVHLCRPSMLKKSIMKKIIFISIILSSLFISCSKEETKTTSQGGGSGESGWDKERPTPRLPPFLLSENLCMGSLF